MNSTVVLTSGEATRKGFRPFTGPYAPEEDWMIQNVIDDMRRGNFARVAIVPTKEGKEVWRILN